jgi:hypothetical protein
LDYFTAENAESAEIIFINSPKGGFEAAQVLQDRAY